MLAPKGTLPVLNVQSLMPYFRYADSRTIPDAMQELFVNPVIAADGSTYEQSAIEDWLSRKKFSPMTNEPLEHEFLIPNLALRRAVRIFREARGEM